MLKCCFLDFRTSFKVLRNFTSSFFDLLHEIMLGLITTPAVRVPADFKKVLLLVFIVVNNQDFYFYFTHYKIHVVSRIGIIEAK